MKLPSPTSLRKKRDDIMETVAPTNKVQIHFRQVIYIILYVIALLFILAIVSYSPMDAAALDGGLDSPPPNWIGSIGAFLGYKLFLWIGLTTYAVLFLILLRAGRALLPGHGRLRWFFLGGILFLIGTMLLLALSPHTFVQLTDRLGIGRVGLPELALTGGVIGQALAAPSVESLEITEGLLRGLIGVVGTTILSWTLLLAGIISIYFADWHELLCQYIHGKTHDATEGENVPSTDKDPASSVPKGLFGSALRALEALQNKNKDPQPPESTPTLPQDQLPEASSLVQPNLNNSLEPQPVSGGVPDPYTQPTQVTLPNPYPNPYPQQPLTGQQPYPNPYPQPQVAFSNPYIQQPQGVQPNPYPQQPQVAFPNPYVQQPQGEQSNPYPQTQVTLPNAYDQQSPESSTAPVNDLKDKTLPDPPQIPTTPTLPPAQPQVVPPPTTIVPTQPQVVPPPTTIVSPQPPVVPPPTKPIKTPGAVPTNHDGGIITPVLDVKPKVTGDPPKPVIHQAEFVLPPISMLSKGNDSNNHDNAEIERLQLLLQRTLDSFKVPGLVTDYIAGPRIIRFEISLDEGINVKKVEQISDNIAMSLSAKSVRVLAPIPGRNVVGIEVPKARSEAVFMRSLMESDAWRQNKSGIPIVLGKNVAGEPVILDLAKAPHLLIAGATGSGKSVCMNTLISSLLFHFSPDDLRLIMVDPKIVEFEDYKRLPHLITPVINESRKVPIALRWAVTEMENRYKILARAGVKKLVEFNSRPKSDEPILDDDGNPLPDKMPILIVIIDELAELMMTDARKDSETYIARIAQLGRAAGVHIVVATQRPSTQIVTGVIKANLPTRIAFRVGQMIDSRVILDQNGAEKLLGMGDMLFLAPGGTDLERVQGALVSDADIKQIVKFVSDQRPQDFNSQVVAENGEDDDENVSSTSKGSKKGSDDGNNTDDPDADYPNVTPMISKIIQKYLRPGDDDNMKQALEIVVIDRQISTSYLQRRLKLGYNTAAGIMDALEARGVVGPASGSGNKREILITDSIEINN